ncbi:hypothetical protein BH09ACT10_BH09ACT10_30220 [soil metagenome]
MNPRQVTSAERRFEVVVPMVGLALFVCYAFGWRDGMPDIGVVAWAALALVPPAVRYQLEVSRASGVTSLGVAPGLLYAGDLTGQATIFPLWALLLAASYLVLRGWGRETCYSIGVRVIAGAALVEVFQAVEPHGNLFLTLTSSLVAYFLVLALAEATLQALGPGSGGLVGPDVRWVPAFLVGIATYYVAVGLTLLRDYVDGKQIQLSTPSSLVLTAIAIIAICVALLVRVQALTRSLDAVVQAAVAMPWRREDINRNLVAYSSAGLGGRGVHIAPEPAKQRSLSVRVEDDLYAITTRQKGSARFTQTDRDLLDAIAHMGSSSLRQAAQVEILTARATTDGLTGLANYSYFREELDRVNRERGEGEFIGLVYIDLDGFKSVNDRHGHWGGDESLRVLGVRLGAFIEGRGLAARFGGDEFAVLLRNVADLDSVLATGEAIREVIGEPVTIGDEVVRLRASWGVAVSAHKEVDVEDLLREADAHMYRRKSEVSQRVSARPGSRVVETVRRIITDGRVDTAYQPIVDLASGQITGFEALVRCRDDAVGSLSPELVVDLAERINLLDDLTRQVADQSVATMQEVRRLCPGIQYLSINVEVSQLDEWSPLLEHFADLADQTDATLILEISERSLGNWTPKSLDVIEKLNGAGIAVSIDDFGTGYSALGSLSQTPVNTVKIDKSLVHGLQDPRQELLMRRVISLIHELGLELVVEGIEDQVAADLIKEMGARYAQGYYFARPMLHDDLMARLTAHGDAAVV